MRIHLTSVYVDDQDKALRFYTEILGFEKKEEFPVGEHRWLTVVSPAEHDGPQPHIIRTTSQSCRLTRSNLAPAIRNPGAVIAGS